MQTERAESFKQRVYASQEGVLDLKGKTRSSLLPWRGQFSPELVEYFLSHFTDASDIVLDPFVGSGTTLFEAALRGQSAYGSELNPAAVVLSRIAEFANFSKEERLSIIDKASMVIQDATQQQSTCSAIRDYINESSDRFVVNLVLAVFVLADEHSLPSKPKLISSLERIKKLVIGLPYTTSPIMAIPADSRNIPLPDNEIDVIITSPPYLNVFNYHQNYRKAIDYLGWNVLSIARTEIGANRKNRQNRYLTVIQYCLDMAQSIVEWNRLLSEHGKIIIVVGRCSKILGTQFFNGAIIRELFVAVGGYQLVATQSRVFTNRFGKQIFEDVIFVERNADIKCEYNLQKIRLTAKNILIDANHRAGSSTLIHEALDKVESVEASPLLSYPDFERKVS